VLCEFYNIFAYFLEDYSFYGLSFISRILLYRVHCLNGEWQKAWRYQRDLYDFLVYNRPLTDSYYLNSFFNTHSAALYSRVHLGGQYSYQQWEIYQNFDKLEEEKKGMYGIFFRLHFFEFAFNKEFAIQLTKQYGIFDIWDALRLLFLTKSVGLECDDSTKEKELSLSQSEKEANSTMLSALFRASPDVFNHIVMLFTKLFFPIFFSPDVLIAYRNNVLMFDDPRDVTNRIDLFRAHAYLACSEKKCFFCRLPIAKGQEHILSFIGYVLFLC
jgi:hypothetical protein